MTRILLLHCSRTWIMISRLLIFLLLTTSTVSAITCSICGQSNLTAPGECTSQFQYDCLPNPANTSPQSNQQQPKILCRTTRTKLAENLFAVVKECVTENEHLNRYPDGKAFGCETVQSNSTFPTTYCVCDQDLCNSRSLDEQLSQPQVTIPNSDILNVRQPVIQIDPPLANSQQQNPSQSPRLPTSNQQNRSIDPNQLRQIEPLQNARGILTAGPQQLILPPRPVDEFAVPVNQPPPDASRIPPSPTLIQESTDNPDQTAKRASNSQEISPTASPQTSRQRQSSERNRQGVTPQILVAVNTERVEFLPETTDNTSSQSRTAANEFVCLVCGEGNITASQDCQTQSPLDCRPLFRPGATLFCLTKAYTLPTGQSQIEKRCASEEQLVQELALQTVQASCFSGQDGHVRIDYCICSSSKCNQLPISNQANMYPPLSPADRVGGTPSTSRENQSGGASATTPHPKMCYVCGESDQAHPSDCSQQYEYDCSRQYPQNPVVLCLTRQTKVASGRFNIEKRCITPAEHQLQYPDNEVTLNGCNEAWSGYVQYCVCQGDFCNAQNITLQQQAHNWVQKPVEIPNEDDFEFEEDTTPVHPQTTRLITHGSHQTQVPTRLPNGLLVPPSTRLPINPDLANATINAERTRASTALAPGSNFVEETIPPNPSTRATTMLNPWDNRVRHDGQHRYASSENSQRANASKNRAPTSSRRGGPEINVVNDPLSDNASTSSPGFLNLLALTILFLIMLR